MVAARLNLESAYKTAVKDYTRGKQDEKATLVEKELDAFRKADAVVPPVLPTPPGPFQVRSVWVSDNPAMSLTVTERRGGTFRARFLIGEKIDRDVIGTIKDNKLTWLGKDAKALKGTPGNDNYGTITNDQIDFVWRNDTGGSGTFTLRLHKIK